MGTVRFYAKRELRQKFGQFLPILLVCAALSFAGVSILILGASLTRGALDETLAYFEAGIYDLEHHADYLNENFLMEPMYLSISIFLVFMFFISSAVLFAIRNEEDARELGILRTLGLKRRDLLRLRLLEALFCYGAGTALGLILGTLTMKGYSVYMLARYEGTFFVALKFSFPLPYVLFWTLVYAGAVLVGVLIAHPIKTDVNDLIHAGIAVRRAGQELKGSIDGTEELPAYGALYVRRARRRIVKNNLAAALGLVLPMFFVLGGATLHATVASTADFSLSTIGIHAARDAFIPQSLVREVRNLPGVKDLNTYETGSIIWDIEVWAEGPEVHEEIGTALETIAETYRLEFTDVAVQREKDNAIGTMYRIFLYLIGGMLFCAAVILNFASVRANLRVRRREIAVLRALGAKREQIHRTLAPETVANFAVGSGLSVLIGVGGFLILTTDACVQLGALLGVVCSLLMLGASSAAQVAFTRRITETMMDEEIAISARRA
jgi:cell division protein FtsX